MLVQFFSWIAVSSATQLFVPKLRVSPEHAGLNARVVGLGAVQPLGGQRQQFLRGSPYVQDPTELPAYSPVAAVSAVSVVAATRRLRARLLRSLRAAAQRGTRADLLRRADTGAAAVGRVGACGLAEQSSGKRAAVGRAAIGNAPRRPAGVNEHAAYE